jgi:hypothetical protein
MKPLFQFLLVGLICFALGGGAFFAWSQYTLTQQENESLKTQLATTPMTSPSMSPSSAASPKPSTQPAAATGTITGTLGYPSEGIPALEIYAINVEGKSYFKVATTQNQSSFSLTGVKPGKYVVVAYEKGGFAGGYTPAVACGLSVNCTDHSLIEISVAAGQTVTGIEIKDWYAPDGTFPTKPK